jgi:hypothetical protein
MRTARTLALAIAAALLAALAAPAPARADFTQSFYADSGDACTYGYTRGTLVWRFPGPVALEVTGVLVDRPTPAEPSFCRDDGFFSTATFTAYSGNAIVDTAAVRADNGEVRIQLTLGRNSAVSRVNRLVVQVCRDPLRTLPPSYCGRPVTYSPIGTTQ